MNIKFKYLILLFLFSAFSLAYSQEELLGAKDLLQKFSDIYRSSVKDYEADIKWSTDNSSQRGTLLFKNPQKLRINFSDPSGQVICSNGYVMWVYVSSLNLILKQDLMQKQKTKTSDGKSKTVVSPVLMSAVGFDRFLSDYSIEYQDTKSKIDYKDGTKVFKFKLLRWKSLRNGFNTVYLTVQDNGLIRKVEGVTSSFRRVTLEIDNIKLNKGISDSTFNYEPPAQANTVENFISNQGEN